MNIIKSWNIGTNNNKYIVDKREQICRFSYVGYILLYYNIASFANVFGRFSTRPLGVIEVITNDRKKTSYVFKYIENWPSLFF